MTGVDVRKADELDGGCPLCKHIKFHELSSAAAAYIQEAFLPFIHATLEFAKNDGAPLGGSGRGIRVPGATGARPNGCGVWQGGGGHGADGDATPGGPVTMETRRNSAGASPSDCERNRGNGVACIPKNGGAVYCAPTHGASTASDADISVLILEDEDEDEERDVSSYLPITSSPDTVRLRKDLSHTLVANIPSNTQPPIRCVVEMVRNLSEISSNHKDTWALRCRPVDSSATEASGRASLVANPAGAIPRPASCRVAVKAGETRIKFEADNKGPVWMEGILASRLMGTTVKIEEYEVQGYVILARLMTVITTGSETPRLPSKKRRRPSVSTRQPVGRQRRGSDSSGDDGSIAGGSSCVAQCQPHRPGRRPWTGTGRIRQKGFRFPGAALTKTKARSYSTRHHIGPRLLPQASNSVPPSRRSGDDSVVITGVRIRDGQQGASNSAWQAAAPRSAQQLAAILDFSQCIEVPAKAALEMLRPRTTTESALPSAITPVEPKEAIHPATRSGPPRRAIRCDSPSQAPPVTSGPTKPDRAVSFHQITRNAERRALLPGSDCSQCETWHNQCTALGLDAQGLRIPSCAGNSCTAAGHNHRSPVAPSSLKDIVSRHRWNALPSPTPDGFWDIQFPEGTTRDRGDNAG